MIKNPIYNNYKKFKEAIGIPKILFGIIVSVLTEKSIKKSLKAFNKFEEYILNSFEYKYLMESLKVLITSLNKVKENYF